MNVFIATALPAVAGFFGVRHHYPLGMDPPDGGSPEGASPDGGVGRGVPGPPPAGLRFTAFHPGGTFPVSAGPAVAHLSGTSLVMLRAAEELESRGIPCLYSPMIPSVPGMLEYLAGRLASVAAIETGPVREAALAARIAASACRVVARNSVELGYLHRTAEIPLASITVVPGPAYGAKTDAVPAVPGPSGGGGAFTNLALALCDTISPEWNVMRFLLAMEKINADAVVVAGRTDSPYARECAARAELNPRVRFLRFDPANPGAAARDVRSAAASASIVVDPSVRGLCGRLAAAASAAGIPSVASGRAVEAADAPGALFTFEPSSWELLHHAVTSAFNRAAASVAAGEGPAGAVTAGEGAPKRSGDGARRNGEIARALAEAYREAAGGPGR